MYDLADYSLLHVLRTRLEYPDLLRKIVSHAKAFETKKVLIEDASSGTSLIQDLQRNGPFRPIVIKPEREKAERLEGQSALIEAGHVLLPESAPWLAEFLEELLSFPGGRFDDQVDSFSQFLGWATTHKVRIHVG